MNDVDIYSDPQEQLIQWGFSAYSTAEGFFPPEYVHSFNYDILPGWRDVGWVLIGKAITDNAAEFFANSLLLTEQGNPVPIALDGELYSFITTTWFADIRENLDALKLAVQLAGPANRISQAIAFGYDQLEGSYGKLNSLLSDKSREAELVGMSNRTTIGYLPAFILIDTGILSELAYLYLASNELYQDANESVESGMLVGYIDHFDKMSQMELKPRKSSPLMVLALGFTAVGAVAIFGLTMIGKGKR